jgi:hypothetical protein
LVRKTGCRVRAQSWEQEHINWKGVSGSGGTAYRLEVDRRGLAAGKGRKTMSVTSSHHTPSEQKKRDKETGSGKTHPP